MAGVPEESVLMFFDFFCFYDLYQKVGLLQVEILFKFMFEFMFRFMLTILTSNKKEKRDASHFKEHTHIKTLRFIIKYLFKYSC